MVLLTCKRTIAVHTLYNNAEALNLSIKFSIMYITMMVTGPTRGKEIFCFFSKYFREFEFEFVDDCIESSGVPRVGSTRPLVG